MTQFSNNLIVGLIVGVFVFAGVLLVAAQEDPFAQLTYPISELGNCASRDNCEVFCDQPKNAETCLSYALEHNLIPEEEVVMARKMLALGEIGGPGGCRAKAECEAYCENIDHIKECILFAEENNLIPEEELNEARKVIAAIDQGLTPPPCKGKAECDIYCSEPAHMETCIEFAIAAGLMPPEEVEDAKKMLQAVKAGATPPNCQGKEVCDIYCREAEHFEECMEFGIAAGFIPPEELENAKKTLQAIKAGVNPPDCHSDEECQVYCAEPENMQQCMEFAIAAGFMPEGEIENARKMLQALKQGFRPPACQGEEECQVYCSQLEHMEECINFSEAAGFMSAEQAEQARKMLELGIIGGPGGCQGEEECQAFCEDPANFETCIDFAVKTGQMTPEEAEQAKQGMQSGQMGAGPGGCTNSYECEAYCNQSPANQIECVQYGVDIGQYTPEQAQQMIEQIQMGTQMPYEQGAPAEGAGEFYPQEGEMMPSPDGTQPMPAGEMPLEQAAPETPVIPGEVPQEEMPEEAPQSLFQGWQQFVAAMITIFFGF